MCGLFWQPLLGRVRRKCHDHEVGRHEAPRRCISPGSLNGDAEAIWGEEDVISRLGGMQYADSASR